MSDGPRNRQSDEQDEESPQGPNLVVVYSLLGLALLIAVAAAALIVWPFYKAR